jgi:F420-non-reducing hydrogenase iron-sulfur subunit
MKLIRVMCSGRVDLSFVLRAFSNGMDGVFIGGCHLNECHYITDGNHHAYSMVQLCKKLMRHMGLNPERLRIEQMSAGEGIRFAELTNEFSKRVKELGPLGKAEGIDADGLKFKLQAVKQLIPYIRLVEKERLGARCKSSEEYEEFFRSEETERLFRELIEDKLTITEILILLRESPRSTGELSRILNLDPSEISRHLSSSSKQGLARFDAGQKRYVAA